MNWRIVRITSDKHSVKSDFFSSLRKVCNCIYQTLPPQVLITKLKLVELWQSYQITNYEYLYYLNMLSGRSFNSFSQYPVYPWLVREIKNQVFNLLDDDVYRDLSVCSSALSEYRKERAEAQFHILTGDMAEEDCQWRFHYLPAAHIFEYLIRFEPFVTQHIILQNRKFDHADRLFYSIPSLWEAMYGKGNTGKECIPEFYTLPQMLKNENQYDLGLLHDRLTRVDDVILPVWAKNNYHYVAVNRMALECPYTSQHLNKWIDLIFGVYRDDEAHWTVFHPYMYPEKPIKPENDSRKRETMLQFGAIPCCLFTMEHPGRHPWARTPLPQIVDLEGLTVVQMQKQVALCDPPTVIDARGDIVVRKELPQSGYGRMLGVSRSQGLIVFGSCAEMYVTIFNIADGTVRTATHDLSLITCASVAGGRFLITGGSDGSLRLWKLANVELLSVSTFHCDSLVSVAGCAEIGLLVSIDVGNNMIFETMFQHKFIRIVKLPSNNTGVPRICVFKSGSVVVAYNTKSGPEIRLFDVRGELLQSITVEDTIVEAHKYYDFNTREFLFFSSEDGTVHMHDVITLQKIASFELGIPRSVFSMCKNAQGFSYESSGKMVSHDFGPSIEFVVESVT